MVMLTMMLSAGAMGGGLSSAISRALGARQPKRVRALEVHALWIGVVAGAATTAALLLWNEPIFALLGGSGEALTHAVAYAQVAFVGSIFVWVLNTFSSVIRGAGHMAMPSFALLAISVVQVLAGGALGLGWGPFGAWGMRGVAAGQVIAYGIGAVALWFYVKASKTGVGLAVRGTPLQRELALDILKVGALACISPLQTVLTILIVTRLVAQFGTQALAGYGIGTRLEFLLIPIAFAIGVASVPLVGMAIGAGLVVRARRVACSAAALAAGLLSVIGAVVALWPGLWSGLFTADAGVQAAAASYFHWAGPCYGLFGPGLCLYFSSMGARRVAGPVLAGTLRLVVVAVGGAALAAASTPAWAIFALVALAMAAYGVATALFVALTPWGEKRGAP